MICPSALMQCNSYGFSWIAEVLAKRGAQSVVRDLLVGFDPVAVLLRMLEDRYGEAATFCADALGGAVVGVKWHPQVTTHGILCMRWCLQPGASQCTRDQSLPAAAILVHFPLENGASV